MVRIISGAFKGRKVFTIKGEGYRPATAKVRQAIFSMLESRGVVWEHCRVADIFAGSGSLGLECLSRGAPFALFVEKNRQACSTIKKTSESFHITRDRYALACGDSSKVLGAKPSQQYNLIFIDPPYGLDMLRPTLSLLKNKGWLDKECIILAEVEAQLPLPEDILSGYHLDTNRTYGQTRILLWQQ